MSKEERKWHPKFIEYMDFIISHPNYNGLPIDKKTDGTWAWLAPKQSKIGEQRIAWCKKKARELNIKDEPGVYANVMREIHPTKEKVCQICGRKMSILYHYPTLTTINALKKSFGVHYKDIEHISDIWDDLLSKNFNHEKIADFFIKKGNLSLSANSPKDKIINALEYISRTTGKKILSPGVMSNFPDRFDGFHSYNKCCRASQDKGRSKENLKSYTKDRRAYEYWSNGNIHAANNFMGSNFFNETTADHIGPISLGFVHDPRYLQPMSQSNNSSKRDHLQKEDIDKIIETEKRTKIYPMSWYSKKLWEYIRKNYKKHPESIETLYRDALKQNFSNYMYILWVILDKCGSKGEVFLETLLLKPNYEYFNFSYKFNELGEIIQQTPRHFTERSKNEIERYKRIAFLSVYDYNNKENRNQKNDLTKKELLKLSFIVKLLNNDCTIKKSSKEFTKLIEMIQLRIITEIKKKQ